MINDKLINDNDNENVLRKPNWLSYYWFNVIQVGSIPIHGLKQILGHTMCTINIGLKRNCYYMHLDFINSFKPCALNDPYILNASANI